MKVLSVGVSVLFSLVVSVSEAGVSLQKLHTATTKNPATMKLTGKVKGDTRAVGRGLTLHFLNEADVHCEITLTGKIGPHGDGELVRNKLVYDIARELHAHVEVKIDVELNDKSAIPINFVEQTFKLGTSPFDQALDGVIRAESERKYAVKVGENEVKINAHVIDLQNGKNKELESIKIQKFTYLGELDVTSPWEFSCTDLKEAK